MISHSVSAAALQTSPRSSPWLRVGCPAATREVAWSASASRSRDAIEPPTRIPVTREPMIGRAGQGMSPGARQMWWRAGWIGVAYRGGVAAAATGTLICACRDRTSALRRMVPLTAGESRGSVHRSDGDRSRSGERPGTPPARAGAPGAARRGPGPRRCPQGLASWLSGQLAIVGGPNERQRRARWHSRRPNPSGTPTEHQMKGAP